MTRWPLFRVAISGSSMEPALVEGEWWLALRTRRIHVGDVVVVAHPELTDTLAVKRLTRRAGRMCWVEGDNPPSSRDSRHFGPIDEDRVVGRLLVRYAPIRRRSRRRLQRRGA